MRRFTATRDGKFVDAKHGFTEGQSTRGADAVNGAWCIVFPSLRFKPVAKNSQKYPSLLL
jgi:hypothetical protein